MSTVTDRIAALPAAQQALLLQRLRAQQAAPPAAVVRYQPVPQASMRLFCFPYAGGGASMFRQWASMLPEQIEVLGVQYPGRESRIGEPAHRRMGPLLDDLVAAMLPLLDRPCVFYGHSMGALVAFALTRRLRQHGIQPRQLFLAAYRAPHLPNPNIRIYHLPPEVFKVVLRAEGIAETILQNDELMQAMLPTLRADFELCDTYDCTEDMPLACPLAIFGGTEDVRISAADLQAWPRHTTATCELTMLPGAHFFLHSAQDTLLGMIGATIRGHLQQISISADMAAQ